MGFSDYYKSEQNQTKDRQMVTRKFCTAHETTGEKSIYRMGELFAHYPPNEGLMSIIHSIFIVCREFKKQDSDYKMSSCFEQSRAHEAQSISSVTGETEATAKYQGHSYNATRANDKASTTPR